MSHLWSDDSKTSELNCRQFKGNDCIELSEAWCLGILDEDEYSPYPLQCFLEVLLQVNAAYCRGTRHRSFEIVVSDLRKFLCKLSERDVLYGKVWAALAEVDDDYGFIKLCKDLLPHMYS